MLSPAELAVRLDEDLVALMAASCPHGRAEHVSPSPDVQYPVGDRARDGAATTRLCPGSSGPGRLLRVFETLPVWGYLPRRAPSLLERSGPRS